MKTHFVLLDYENVQPASLACLRGCELKAKLFVGATQSKVPVAFAAELQRLGENAEYIPIQGTGRNALDFHIAYYIGRLSAEFPDAVFHIISKDTGFEPLIKHLRSQNIACHRWPALNNIPGLTPAEAPASALDLTQKVADNLLKRGPSKPRRLNALNTIVKTFLGPQATDTDAGHIVAQLEHRGVLSIADGKVSYPSV